MEITVEHLGAHVQFEVRARTHSIVTTIQPRPQWRLRRGYDPAGVAACFARSAALGHYAAQYLRKMKLASGATRVRVTWATKSKDPVARLDNFVVRVDSPRGAHFRTASRFAKFRRALPGPQHAAPSADHRAAYRSPGPRVAFLSCGRLVDVGLHARCERGSRTVYSRVECILPRISFTIFAATIAVIPVASRAGLNSTTSAPTIGPGTVWI